MPGLIDVEIERLAAAGRIERVERGTVVPLDAPMAAVVLAGCWRVFRNAAFARDVTLFLAKRGDVLASGALFGQRVGESGAQAIGPAAIALIAGESFAAVADDNPALYFSLARNIAHRTAQVQAKLERFSRAPAQACVAAALLELCEDFGIPQPAGGHRLQLPLSQADLARLAGTTRETTSTAMAAFARQGLVKGARLDGLAILDAPGLAAIAAAFI